MRDGQERLARARGADAEHQFALAERGQVFSLGLGLGRHLTPAADGQRTQTQASGSDARAASPRIADRHADVGLGDVVPLVGALGDRLDGLLGLGAALRVAGQRDAAARRFDQHVEGVLDQGGVARVGAGHRAGGHVGQGDEFRRAAQTVSSSLDASAPARLIRAALSIRTATI